MIVVRLCEHRFMIDRLTNVQILVLVLSQLKMILDLSKKSNSNSFNSLMSKMRLRKFLIAAETFETFPKNLEGNRTKFQILINCFYL